MLYSLGRFQDTSTFPVLVVVFVAKLAFVGQSGPGKLFPTDGSCVVSVFEVLVVDIVSALRISVFMVTFPPFGEFVSSVSLPESSGSLFACERSLCNGISTYETGLTKSALPRACGSLSVRVLFRV